MGEAIFVRETGDASKLVLDAHEPGEPSPGELRVAVTACGVNFIDVYFRTGLYPRPLPYVAGLEGAGRVESVGAGVVDFAEGDRVAWTSVPGSYASHALIPEASAVRVPEALSDQTAAAVMLQGMTAHYLCKSTFAVAAGDSALVHAAAGGVGLLLVQMLKEAGASVIATCSTGDKEKLVLEAGADRVIRYADFDEAVSDWTAGRGVDVVYDSVGRDTFEGSLRCLRPRGLLVTYGNASGPPPPFDLLRLNALGSLFVTRPTLAHYIKDRAELELRAGDVLGAAASGKLRVRVGASYPLARAADAHRALEGRATTGKVLLEPEVA